MSRPTIAPITRALDFIETGAPDAVREFMTHAREVCLRRGIIVSGFPTGQRKARVAKPAKAPAAAYVPSVWSDVLSTINSTTVTEPPSGPGASVFVGVLIRNAARCRACETVIESRSRHDFVWCACGKIFVDGGLEYARRGGDLAMIDDLSEYATDTTPEPVYTEHGA